MLSPDHAEIHPVQLGLLRQGRPGHRRGRGPAVAASTAPVWRATRRTSGTCASIRRCWACRFVHGIRRPDRDNAIDVYISDECEDVLARRRVADTLHRHARAADRARRSAHGWPSSPAFRWAATRSSPSGTTSSARAARGVTYIAEPGGSIRDEQCHRDLQ